MGQVIHSVEVIGETNKKFVVGENGIRDIIKMIAGYAFYNDKDELMFEIRNCPVVVTYMEGI